MIETADVIVFADITKVEKVSFKGNHWTYSEKAVLKPIKTLKGKLPANARIYGGENFICAQVHFKPGKALLFLNRRGDYYVGNNWGLSVRPFKNGNIEWLTGENIFKGEPVAKEKVFGEILESIGSVKKKSAMPSHIQSLIKADSVTDKFAGRGGMSKSYEQLTSCLKDRSLKLEDLTGSLKNATPAGKIYIAMIMMKHYPAKAKSTLKSLSEDDSKFYFTSGCEAMNYTVAKAAKELLNTGKLLNIEPAAIK